MFNITSNNININLVSFISSNSINDINDMILNMSNILIYQNNRLRNIQYILTANNLYY